MVRHASWLPAVRAGEWTDAQTGVHSNLRGREGVKKPNALPLPDVPPPPDPLLAETQLEDDATQPDM